MMKSLNMYKFPVESSRLISLSAEDQDELKKLSKAYYKHIPKVRFDKLYKDYQIHSVNRTKEALRILGKIGQPTLENIGEKASVALIVLILHSELADMKLVMKAFKHSKKAIKLSALPALEDKILIFEGLDQKFGTQWMEGEDGQPFLYPVKDFDNVNKLRSKYGLGPIVRPKIMSLNGDSGKTIPANSSDQRMPTEKELKLFKGEFIYE